MKRYSILQLLINVRFGMIMRRKREPYLNNKRKTIDVLCDCDTDIWW